MTALLSPDAPELVASAASVRMIVPSVVAMAAPTASSSEMSGWTHRARGRPRSRSPGRAPRPPRASGSPSVVTKALVWSSGTSVNGLLMSIPAASPPGLRLERRGPSGQPSERPRVRDELVAPDERRDRHPGGHRSHAVVEDPQEQSRRPRRRSIAGRRAGRSGSDTIASASRSIRRSARRAGRARRRSASSSPTIAPRLLEQRAFGIELADGDHRTVQTGVDAVDVGVRADRGEETVGQRPEPVGAQGPGRCVRPGAEARGTAVTPAASNTSSAPPTSVSCPRCAAKKASPVRTSKSPAPLGTGLKVDTSWMHSQTRMRSVAAHQPSCSCQR